MPSADWQDHVARRLAEQALTALRRLAPEMTPDAEADARRFVAGEIDTLAVGSIRFRSRDLRWLARCAA
jgi:hypothetical protein